MPYAIDPDTGRQVRGFAAMSPERRAEIARKGGASVPGFKRSFARNHDLAAAAGSTGGLARAACHLPANPR